MGVSFFEMLTPFSFFFPHNGSLLDIMGKNEKISILSMSLHSVKPSIIGFTGFKLARGGATHKPLLFW
jgi:hypothetical protein